MRKNFGPKNFACPQPVFMIATYGEDGTPNLMNAAWGGISGATEISICVNPRHKTAENLIKRGAFTVSMGQASCVAGCDYVGDVSGCDVPDKLARAGFHTSKSEFVDAPLIDELGLTLECQVKSYDTETKRLVGEIVNVSVDESYVTEDGKIDVSKLGLLAYDTINKAYFVLGEKVADAFKIGMTLK